MPLEAALRAFADRASLTFLSRTGAANEAQYYVYDAECTRRYCYGEVWSPGGRTVLWVMFNPGTGESEGRPRPTLERCRQWSRRRGHGSLLFCNLYSLRTRAACDVGRGEVLADPLNLRAIEFARSLSDEVFVAWGATIGRREIPPCLHTLLAGALCLGHTRRGHPRHPLYVRADAEPRPWHP
ncbi:DUF1643 domain-containing protein [Rubrivivax gelatinosus]|uniref:DUF1643 domain-containing protein n=1 Tax=Rubrivivax gelatinosus TaxID=28068 RepID=A0A4R2LV15_RUBGE|nr:DUF1643 domain-containing protein [Rubrivivax gelatinosus]MBK1690283.1 hypothetical protein [Rubrivivax gelatinosus]TCO97189.1 hypothetical protein EV684_12329 [Rubrivivax gelatinosus]